MSYRPKSWVWQDGKRQGDKAFCDLCEDNSDKVFSCAGGSTGSFGRHLKLIHNISQSSQNPSEDKCHEDEECNTVVNLTQCSLSSSNNLNTECSLFILIIVIS
ncbi:unnamed protein product [Macrosiphum euphorbiae]|uniref:BED-type domain-containing protein n=1 Tax=Macrosiphum euphorbiae TaxID=13131 RepID=A0AAV0WTL8_9HEMI|nr:unnamed protein product [Macrosiphum euphorbiae]